MESLTYSGVAITLCRLTHAPPENKKGLVLSHQPFITNLELSAYRPAAANT